MPQGTWKEFAAFAGPELSELTSWDNKVVLVGDSSHALSGAFGSGAGFAMEDGWVLAQALKYFGNDRSKALSLFDRIRLPYYSRMYEYLENAGAARQERLRELEAKGGATDDDRVRLKVIKEGKDMTWIYEHDIGKTWESAVAELETAN